MDGEEEEVGVSSTKRLQRAFVKLVPGVEEGWRQGNRTLEDGFL